jgi:carbon monoxide dehydrogenase subunit G
VKLDGEYTFDGPREDVWEIVRDPEVLATALPGTQSLEQVSENQYEGVMNVRIGPVGGVFSGQVLISDEAPPEKLTMTVEGKGSPGFVKGSGHVNLIDPGDGTTLMKYDGDLQFGGRIAGVGQRLLDTASKSTIRQGLDELNRALGARLEAKETGEQVEFEPSSETEFMAAVTKDMAGELLTPTRIIWIAVAIVMIILILIVIFT